MTPCCLLNVDELILRLLCDCYEQDVQLRDNTSERISTQNSSDRELWAEFDKQDNTDALSPTMTTRRLTHFFCSAVSGAQGSLPNHQCKHKSSNLLVVQELCQTSQEYQQRRVIQRPANERPSKDAFTRPPWQNQAASQCIILIRQTSGESEWAPTFVCCTPGVLWIE